MTRDSDASNSLGTHFLFPKAPLTNPLDEVALRVEPRNRDTFLCGKLTWIKYEEPTVRITTIGELSFTQSLLSVSSTCWCCLLRKLKHSCNSLLLRNANDLRLCCRSRISVTCNLFLEFSHRPKVFLSLLFKSQIGREERSCLRWQFLLLICHSSGPIKVIDAVYLIPYYVLKRSALALSSEGRVISAPDD